MSVHRFLTAAVVALVLAAPLAAQAASQDVVPQNATPVAAPIPLVAPVVAAERTTSVGPTQSSLTVGVRANAGLTAPVVAPPPSEGSRSPAMMIVGGAALLVGAIVGGNTLAECLKQPAFLQARDGALAAGDGR